MRYLIASLCFLAAAAQAQVSISSFSAATTPTGSELVPCEQGGHTRACTTAQIAALGGGGGSTAFSALTGGTNTSASMILGTGASLTAINSGSIIATAAPLSGITGLGANVGTFLATPSSANLAAAVTNETGSGALVFATAPTITLPNATGLPLTTGVSGILPVANGGTGTASPGIVAGTNVTVSGTWPNQTVNATGGGGGSGTVGSGTSGQLAYYSASGTTLAGLTLGGNLAISSGTLLTSQPINPQTGTSYAFQASDAGKLVTFNNASAVAATLSAATTTGFTAGYAFDVHNSGAGTVTITPTTSTINGSATLTIAQNRDCTISSDGTNYQVSACTALVSTGGTGTVTTSGSPTSGQLAVFSSSTAITGASANTLALAALEAQTTFTVAGTGCTPSAHVGGPFAGSITLAATCTAVTVTMNGATGFTATNGYHCNVGDKTTQAAGTFIPLWGESASTTTTATLPIPSAAGTTDVITFNCTAY